MVVAPRVRLLEPVGASASGAGAASTTTGAATAGAAASYTLPADLG